MEKEKNIELRNMWLGFGIIFLYLIASAFPYDLLGYFGINYNNLNIIFKQIYLIFYEIGLTLIIVYIYRKDFIPNFKEFFKNIKKFLSKYIRYWYLILVLMIISNYIITMFTTTLTSQNQQAVIDSFKRFPIYTIMLTVLTAPVLEELVFRLSFRKIFAHTDILFIIFSGLFFGGMHVLGSLENLIDLLFIIPYSIPGFVFAYLYTKSKNIFVPISLHFIHNAVMMILQIILLFI